MAQRSHKGTSREIWSVDLLPSSEEPNRKQKLLFAWPFQVDGDTVTITFEMRSGREHNTPDKAMWGFLITVRAQESTEEVQTTAVVLLVFNRC